MLIPIKRYYKASGLIKDILLNTNYIIRIEPCPTEAPPMTSRIIMPGFERRSVQIIYTTYEVSYIKGLLTKAQNKNQENG